MYAFTEFRLQMITDLDLLLHHLEGELEQGDEVSHLHDGGVITMIVAQTWLVVSWSGLSY